MMHPRAYIHACAAGLLPLLGVAGLFGGVQAVVSTAIAGLAVLVHLVLGERVLGRFVRAAARQDDPAAVGRLVLRQLTIAPLAFVLLAYVGPVASGLAFASLALGALLHAAGVALQRADAHVLSTFAEASC